MATRKADTKSIEAALRAHALSYPETREDFPWGERAIKVKDKAFLFLRADDTEVSFSVKLPRTGYQALALPFVEPTHYGLGRHGWVTARVPAGGPHPVEDFKAWIDESYRAVAPKKLVSQLDGSSAEKAAKGAAPAPKAAKRATSAAKGTKRASPAARKRR